MSGPRGMDVAFKSGGCAAANVSCHQLVGSACATARESCTQPTVLVSRVVVWCVAAGLPLWRLAFSGVLGG